MTDQYDKICPLLSSNLAGNNRCKGTFCAFSAPKHKSFVDDTGQIQFKNDGWYCLVCDFLITMVTMASGE